MVRHCRSETQGSPDAVICQFGLQFFPDPALALREFRRVLRIGSCAAACVIATPDRAPMWGILADVLSRFLPGQRNILDLSFALADPQRLENLFAGAGFRDIRVGREKRVDVITGFDNYWDAIETGTGSLPQLYLSLSEADRHDKLAVLSMSISTSMNDRMIGPTKMPMMPNAFAPPRRAKKTSKVWTLTCAPTTHGLTTTSI